MGKLLTKRIIENGMHVPGGKLCICTMQSDVLNCEKAFTVYLPEGYEASEAPYPVMYLFHQAGGTNETWSRIGHVREILDDGVRSQMVLPMIIVMPDASGEDERHLGRHLGFFSVEGWDYEKYFFEELLPLVEREFRTRAEKAYRAICGVSMGGEGAIAYAQRYPEYFGSGCAISGIVGKPEQSQLRSTDAAYAQSLLDHNPSAYVKNADADTVEKLKSVRWYADCGDSDFFYEGNIEFFLNMKNRGIPMDFRMRSGVHGFYYWITGMPAVLQFVSNGFAEEALRTLGRESNF